AEPTYRGQCCRACEPRPLEDQLVSDRRVVLREGRVDRDVAVAVALTTDRAAVDVTVARGPDSHRVPLRRRAVATVRAHVDADESAGGCLCDPGRNKLGEAKPG